jgi:hypothetical protein
MEDDPGVGGFSGGAALDVIDLYNSNILTRAFIPFYP